MTRKLLILAGIAFTVVLLTWYALAWSPATKRLHSSQAALAAALSTQASLTGQETALLTQARRLPVEKAKADYLSDQLPPLVDVPGFIDEVTKVARNTHVALQGVAQSVTAPTAGSAQTAAAPTAGAQTVATSIGVLALQFSITGTFAQTMKFITAMQQLPRLSASPPSTSHRPMRHLRPVSRHRPTLTMGCSRRCHSLAGPGRWPQALRAILTPPSGREMTLLTRGRHAGKPAGVVPAVSDVTPGLPSSN